MCTIADCLLRHKELLNSSDSALLDTELLLAEALNKERTYLRTWPEKALSDEQLAAFSNAFSRRLTGEPVAHILGYREFWTLRLAVNPSTLIPRPDTEILVEQALQAFQPDEAITVLDLGTGTGAIALALASECPNWHITAVDVEPAAVALAQHNQQYNQLNNVTILRSDWFTAIDGQRFDMIVSNPPYIAHDDAHLSQGDVRFEPDSALTADNNGMADIEHIAGNSRQHLKPNGRLLLEHGYNQGQAARDCLLQQGFQQVRTVKDYGDNDRITLGQYSTGQPL
ncbi:Release factor glutamine methyltransferase [Sinobacterium norvegicum]|uniref:Release factor glutamine methyltransferase n=1 Tax=Sinobacterium norvegicum TaxID=1641715 RepID=A0ABN8EGG8_9GAMM|nr:peptide chain release factor N(5)-glutamine methyltransferase [Sinobacterium norvegicum]CAH0991427.1 Release factor glutamine methyltransferase [Sinobacterium norvegicum]